MRTKKKSEGFHGEASLLDLLSFHQHHPDSRLVPLPWSGWLSIVYGLVGLVLVGFTADNVPPFLRYLIPILISVLLLLRQGQISPENDER